MLARSLQDAWEVELVGDSHVAESSLCCASWSSTVISFTLAHQ